MKGSRRWGVLAMLLGCYQSVVVGELEASGTPDAATPRDAATPPDLGTPDAPLPDLPEADLGPPATSDAVSVSAGNAHSCVLFESGEVACWGDLSGPTAVTLPRPAVALFDGSCANLEGGGAACGLAGSAWLADDVSEYDDVANRLAGRCLVEGGRLTGCGLGSGTSADGVVDVASGFAHICVLGSGGEVRCIGANQGAQCGQPPSEEVEAFTPVPGLPRAQAITAGAEHTCALADGVIYCWGRGAEGQLGDGRAAHGRVCITPERSFDCTERPVRVAGIDDAVEITSAALTTCVRRATGELACFGSNEFGLLGAPVPAPDRCDDEGCALAPVAVLALTDAVGVRAGNAHVCAASRSAVRCWGLDTLEPLFNGSITDLRAAAGLR